MKPKYPVYISVKDHSVSKERFQLLHNTDLDLLETFPQPKADKLSQYYKSDNYISHTNSKRNIIEYLYHLVRQLSIKRKLNLLNSFELDDRKLLDIGCGTGHFLEAAAHHNWTITGIESDDKARTIANSKTKNAVFEPSQLEHLQPQSFDVITLWHVLEHLPNLDNYVTLLQILLKPNGVLVIAVPNFKSYDAHYYKDFWAAFDVPRHLWHFSETAIEKVFKKQNMALIKTIPMPFDAYYVSLLSEKYKTGKTNLLKAFRMGWRSNQMAKRTKQYSSHIYLLKKTNISN